MNLFELVLKQMRQRALGTVLTVLSVLLGVALATAVIVFQREGERMFVQSDFGYDMIVGPVRGSPLQLTLNTVYHLDVSPGLVDYKVYTDLLANRALVRLAVPIAKGDTYSGLPIIGCVPRMFNYTNDEGPGEGEGPKPITTEGDNVMAPFEYRRDKSYQLAEGRMFHPRKFEALIGSEVTGICGLKLGDGFKATHGNPKPGEVPDIHDQVWTVVGKLKRTGTAADRGIYIPLVSFFAIAEHESALDSIAKLNGGADPAALASPTQPSAANPPPTSQAAGHEHDHDHDADEPKKFHMDNGLIQLDLPVSEWKLSAVLVRTRSAPQAMTLKYQLDNTNKASASYPGETMRQFFAVFLRPSTQVLLAVAALVSVVAGIGILVSIYNSVSARMREIAILRALGATRVRVLLIICTEAGLVGLIGGVAGTLAGHGLVWVGAHFVPDNLGEINALRWTSLEPLYLGAVVTLSMLAGLVPAMKAYRVTVAENLTV